jgi:riboflavin synthase
MFTGIILAVGRIAEVKRQGGDFRLKIQTGKLSLSDAQLGDSIAVNGVCLTAVELGADFFCADVSNETLSKTTLKTARVGDAVNLEPALTPTTRLGGHLVSGHVDGLGTVISKEPDARSWRFRFKAPDELAKYIAAKGSICINGVSLTVNTVDGAVFAVNIVPHTLQETMLGTLETGSEVNLEVDILARYLERLMQGEQAAKSGGVTEHLLHSAGFMS